MLRQAPRASSIVLRDAAVEIDRDNDARCNLVVRLAMAEACRKIATGDKRSTIMTIPTLKVLASFCNSTGRAQRSRAITRGLTRFLKIFQSDRR